MTSTPVNSPWAPAAGCRVTLREARDLGQHLLQLVHELQRALDRGGILERVDTGEAGIAGDRLVDLRVVLHRAGAERIHVDVDGVVLLADPGVMADDVDLADLGPVKAVTQHIRGKFGFGDVGRWQMHGAPPAAAEFVDQRFDRHA